MYSNINAKFWRDKGKYGFMLVDKNALPDEVKEDMSNTSNITNSRKYSNSIYIDKRDSQIDLRVNCYYKIQLKSTFLYGVKGWKAVDPILCENSSHIKDDDFIPLSTDSNPNLRYFYEDRTGNLENRNVSFIETSNRDRHRSRSPSNRDRHRSRSPSNRYRHRSRSPSNRYRHRSRSPSNRDRYRDTDPYDRYHEQSSYGGRYHNMSTRTDNIQLLKTVVDLLSNR